MLRCGADSHNRCRRAAVCNWVVQEVPSTGDGRRSFAETPLTCQSSPGRRTPVSVGVNGIAPGAAIGMPPRRDHPMQPVQGHQRAVRDAMPEKLGYHAESLRRTKVDWYSARDPIHQEKRAREKREYAIQR